MDGRSSERWLARELGLQALALVITSIVMWFFLGLGQADFRYPIAAFAGGDVTYYGAQVKILLETGWVYHHPDLGAPFGLDLYDFAHFDALHLLIMKLIGYAVADWAIVLNTYYLLTYVLATATALILFRHLRVNAAVAVGLAILFAFQPYHSYRGQAHIMLSAYYLLPLQMLAVVWLLSPSGLCDEEGVRLGRSWRCWVACLIVFAAAFAGHYYAAFGWLASVTAAAHSSIARKTWRPVIHAGLLTGVLVAGFTINLAPNALYWLREGGNRVVSHKHPSATEVHGLRLVPILLPVKNHRVGPMREVSAYYEANTPLRGGESQQSVGLLAASGIVVLMALGIFARRTEGLLAGLGVVTVVLVLTATLSGAGTLFAYLFTAQWHALCRIAILLALLGLMAVGQIATSGIERLGRPILGAALAVCVGVVGLFDLWPTQRQHPLPRMANQYLAVHRFAQAIQQAVPEGTIIHQMPARSFPLSGYEQFQPYLFTKGLRWTCPAMLNRRGMAWCQEIESLPAETMLERLAVCGVGAIILEPEDRFPRTREMRQLLTALRVPRVESEAGKTLFDLRAVKDEICSRYDGTELERRRVAASMPITVRWGGGYGPPEPSGGCGSLARAATLEIVNHLAEPVTARLTMTVKGDPEAGELTMSSPALPEAMEARGRVSLDLTVPPGRTPVTIRADGKTGARRTQPYWFHVEGLECRVAEVVTRR